MRQRVLALMLAALIQPTHAVRARAPAFEQALAPQELHFPRDQGPHPDFRQEWWYMTGNLDSAAGERFGFELTVFRFALAPTAPTSTVGSPPAAEDSHWRTRQIYLGHFAITDVARHRFRFAVKLSRGALGLAGAVAVPFAVWVGNWRIGEPLGRRPASPMSAHATGGAWTLRASEPGYALALTARPLMPPVLNGEQGWSPKSGEPGDATYYYSVPRIAVEGTLDRDGRPLPVHGLAWLDREWGSGSLGPREVGWDWFGLQLEDGSCLMFYALRDRDGAEDPYSAGTWVDAHGEAHPLTRTDLRIEVLHHWTDAGGARYPSRWRLIAPALDLDLEVRPVLPDQELVTSPRYWEGAVDVTGARAGRAVHGRGYVELVGYAGTSVGPVGIR